MPGTAAPSRRRTQPAPAPHTHSTADAELTASLDAAGTPVVASTAHRHDARTLAPARLARVAVRRRTDLRVRCRACSATIRGSRTKPTRSASSSTCSRPATSSCRPMPACRSWKNRRSTRGSRPASPGCCSASCRCTTRPGSRARCSPHWHSASSRARRASAARDAWLDLRVIGPVVLSAGTLVVIKHVHDMMTDVALFAGTAIAFCGLLELVMQHVTRAQQMRHGLPVRPSGRWAAPIFGAGVGIALMTKGCSYRSCLPPRSSARWCSIRPAAPARSRARSASQHWCSRRSRSSGRPHCSCARDAVHDVVLG